jgi:hypothetical protein
MIRSDQRGDRRNLQRVSGANGIWSRLRNDHDALLRVGAARRHLHALVCARVFRGVGLWMARRNLALRHRGTRVGIRRVVEVERSPRERLGGCRNRPGLHPSGTIREPNVIHAANTWRRSPISHVVKTGERVLDLNVSGEGSLIDDSLGPAGIVDRERDDVCSRRPSVCKREHDGLIRRYVGAVPHDATLVDIYGSQASRRHYRSRTQQQSATGCQHEPGDSGPITQTSSHGVVPTEYAALRAGGSLRTDDPLGYWLYRRAFPIIANRCPG